MAAFVKFEIFSEDLAKGFHDLDAAGHVVAVYLSNVAPVVGTDVIKSGLAEITIQNGYTGPVDTAQTISRTGLVTSVIAGTDPIVITATGAVGPFRYVVLFNDTQTTPVKPLIAYWDYGAGGVTLANGETFTIDFGTEMFTIT